MTPESFLDHRVKLYCGDCMEILREFDRNHFDACVTDPPYHLTSIVKRFGQPNSAPVKLKKLDGQGGSPFARGARGFMGKQWDGGDIAFQAELWRQVFEVLKPGAHLVAFGGARTYHRMACAIEDAGFEIRDQIQWLYGSGFPKSHDVSKGIDRAAGAEREVIARGDPVKRMIPGADQNKAGWEKTNGREYVPTETEAATEAAREWEGWGSALKPACEPIVLARKPLSEPTIAANVLKWGTGALNIDGCRVGAFINDIPPGTDRYNRANFEMGYRPSPYGREGEASAERRYTENGSTNFAATPGPRGGSPSGRWPANVIHDGSQHVIEGFPTVGDSHPPSNAGSIRENHIYGADIAPRTFHPGFPDSGSAARFFYTAKADADERLGSKHPTVKPVDLMQWLVRLVTRPGGTILDPFAGTGTTGAAAFCERMVASLIEREPEYQADIRRRMALVLAGPEERAREAIKAGGKTASAGPLFDVVTP